MKKLFFLSVMALSLAMTSCTSDSPNNLSSGTIEDTVEELLETYGLDKSYSTLMTGYYECNNESTRVILAKLAAAGVIKYEVERYAWWNKHLSAGYYFGHYYGNQSYSFEEHFMVNVELTEQGKKLCVDSIPTPEPKMDKDMEQPELDPKLPENNYKKEEWPVIPNPEAPEADTEEEEAQEVVEQVKEEFHNLNNIFSEIEEEKVYEDHNNAILPLDLETKVKYETAKEKQNTKEVILRSSSQKVVKGRYIQTKINPATGLAEATAEVIIKMVDVTPAGRILDGKREGTRLCAPVEYIYYNDRGWILKNDHLELNVVSTLALSMLKNAANAVQQVANGLSHAIAADTLAIDEYFD